MNATGIAASTTFSATAFPAPVLVACRADGSEQELIASAFVSAAIRLGRELPTDSAESAGRPPHISAARPPYIGRHRRTITARSGSDLQAVRS